MMNNIVNELLFAGALMLAAFEVLSGIDSYCYHHSVFCNVIPFMVFSVVIFLLYLFAVIIFGVKLLNRFFTDYPDVAYYVKSVGWIFYAYIICGIVYFISLNENTRYLGEKLWNDYPISWICIGISLVIAWVRKNPRFLVD